MASSPRLISRLYKDLSELWDQPYPGVTVFADDANIRQLCLVLTPPSGPWKGLALHFDVVLPTNWPTSPPAVSSSVVGIQHPNLFGNYICCDLLKPQSYSRGGGYTGGYSPALTLRGLFLQFLTFFSSTKVEQDYGDSIEIGEAMIVAYLRDSDLILRLTIDGRRCCKSYQACFCQKEASDQARLDQLWNRSKVPEEQVATYMDEDDAQVLHLSKNTGQGVIHKIEKPNPRWTATYHQIKRWTCTKCPYGSNKLPHLISPDLKLYSTFASDLTAVPPSQCQIDKLNVDTLSELANHLSSESVISLSSAYPPFGAVVASFHLLLHREVRCFFLRSSLSESVLGVGVALEQRTRMLASEFDWLSQEAFEHHGVRRSIQKHEFQYFLPLAFNSSHFQKAEPEVWKCLALLDTALQKAEFENSQRSRRPAKSNLVQPIQPHQTVRVLFKMMNNIVVSLMKSCDESLKRQSPYSTTASRTLLCASEKAIIAYCHLFHLVICLCRTNPPVLKEATVKLRQFITQPASRVKAQTPDMGELIVLITIVLSLPTFDNGTPITWSSINGLVLEETFTRNARWILKDLPELEVMEEGVSNFLLENTFTRSKTSLRLIMFQVIFLNIFNKCYSTNLSRLDDNYGFADKEIPEAMVEEIKNLYSVETWPKFFAAVQYENGTRFTKEVFSNILRNAIRTSASRGYHEPPNFRRMEELKGKRARLESYLKQSAPLRR